ncbi:MAG: helix-hairpin-helix domain-containing protein [Gammaproteobacteria bacterium]|nr:helix-hairpin-helix domain-containing protein [Gammaproteobacteria bacterium]
MSFYRTLLAAVAAVAIASPVFADETANATQNPANEAAAPAAQQVADNSSTQPTATTGAEQNTPAAESKVNLNKASAKELTKVKGINASKAKAIVAYRKKHGDFKSIEDLKKVKGFTKIKSDSLKSIEDQLDI